PQEQPAHLQRPPHPGESEASLREDALPDMAPEHADRRRAGRPDHPGAGAAGRLRAGPADGQVGRAARHRDLPDLPGALDPAVHPDVTHRRDPGLARHAVGVAVPTNLVRGDVFFWGSLMAACLITSLPVAFLYNLFLNRFISGFTLGAIR